MGCRGSGIRPTNVTDVALPIKYEATSKPGRRNIIATDTEHFETKQQI